MKNFLLQKKQFLLYCVIGASGVLLDFGIYLLLVQTKAINLNYQAANAVGYASGTLLSFSLNSRFNFRVTDKIALRLASFFSIALIGWLLSAALLQLLIGHYGLGKVVSKVVTLFIVVLLQYNLNRRISFRKAN
ncbi:MAG TPA: GtrA family protein [Verrucomicrobiae bacterium]